MNTYRALVDFLTIALLVAIVTFQIIIIYPSSGSPSAQAVFSNVRAEVEAARDTSMAGVNALANESINNYRNNLATLQQGDLTIDNYKEFLALPIDQQTQDPIRMSQALEFMIQEHEQLNR